MTNTPDVLTEATAELAFALMLAAARRIGEGERLVRSRDVARLGARPARSASQLPGKTLGIVGFGRIGQAMARRALRRSGCTSIYADPHEVPAGLGDGYRSTSCSRPPTSSACIAR